MMRHDIASVVYDAGMNVIKLLSLLVMVEVVFVQPPLLAGDGPVHRWRFDREHLRGNTATPVIGSVALVGKESLAFDVAAPGAAVFARSDQTKQFLETRDGFRSLNLPRKALTAEAWVRVDQPLEWGGIFGAIQDNGDHERGWLLGYRKSQFFFALVSEKTHRVTYLTSPKEFVPGQWYHVVGVWDGTTQSLFVDGELATASRAQSGAIAYPLDAHFGVGGFWDDTEYHPLTGQVEQVSIWQRAFKADEVAKQFDSRKARFPGIEAVHPEVIDWPTHLRDNQRTGVAKEVALNFPLHLRWVHRSRHTPAPAWPPPARQDFWHKKHGLKPRVTLDRAHPLIAVGDAVYYSSSTEDQVVCLDRTTGEVRWRVFAEAPVRLAPTYYHGRILFGSDDGCVYCVSAGDGSLMWKNRLVQSDRQIVGNGRVMSVWPVRSGVLVDDGKAFFCAGLFPEQGAYQAAVDVATGDLLGRNTIGVSAQGYLQRKGSRLHIATGRDPAGAFVATLSRRGKPIGKEVRSIPARYPYAFVGDSQSRFGGGHDEVAAFDAQTGDMVWKSTVAGDAYSMAIAGSNLLVSTSQGAIYCFSEMSGSGSQLKTAEARDYPWASDVERTQFEKHAADAIAAAGTTRGWTLVLNSREGALAAAIANRSEFRIVCVEDDPAAVALTRNLLDAMGLSGRVVVHAMNPEGPLPYSDYLFNLVIDAEAIDGQGSHIVRQEARRVTRPQGGVAILGLQTEDVFHRGALSGIGEWTHQYADAGNTVCSDDTLVRGAMWLQWFGAPGPRGLMDRHHRTAAPLVAQGRLFVPGDNRVVAVDAYNGTVLWNADVPESRRAGVYRDCSYLTATGDSLYVSAAEMCRHFDAQTGEQRHLFKVPESDGQPVEWGYLATVDDLLFGTRQKKGSTRRDHSLAQIEEGTYYDARPLVCSDAFFALERQTGEVFWNYEPKAGPIVNSTIAVADGRVYFLESADSSLMDSSIGRHRAADLFRSSARLTALDMRTGSLLWQTTVDLQHIAHTVYLSSVRDRVVITGSYNKSAAGKPRVHVDVSVFDAETGKRLWAKTQNNGAEAGGAHGEQDLHPVIVGNKLYCEPFAYNLQTGQPLDNWKWHAGRRRGCGTISASASTFFFRHSHPTMFDLAGNEYAKVTTSSRPGCWINMIPAGGLLLIPEASSGCTCNYAVQSSMAFLPAPTQ